MHEKKLKEQEERIAALENKIEKLMEVLSNETA
jgi:hypothetical protein